jgi:hypothetical protein
MIMQPCLTVEELYEEVDNKLDAIENLVAIRDNIEEYGITEQFVDLVDDNKQLSSLLNIDVEPGNEELVLEKIDGYFKSLEEIVYGTSEQQPDGSKWNYYRRMIANIIARAAGIYFAAWLLAQVLFDVKTATAIKEVARATNITSKTMVMITIMLSITLGIGLAILLRKIVYLISYITRLTYVAITSKSVEDLNTVISATPYNEFSNRLKLVEAGVKLYADDVASDFKNTHKNGIKYKSIVEKLGYKLYGKKYKLEKSTTVKQGNVTQLGWDANKVNSVVKTMKTTLPMLQKLKSVDVMKKINDTKNKVTNLRKQAESSAGGKQSTREDKQAAKQAFTNIKTEAKTIAEATKAIISEYKDLTSKFDIIHKQF